MTSDATAICVQSNGRAESKAVPLVSDPVRAHLRRWLGLPWPPQFFIPGCFCCGGGASGYSCGGVDAFSTSFYAQTDRTSFATDVTSNIAAAALSTSRGEAAGVANPGVAGYVAGGRTSSLGAVALCDKLTFSTGITSAVGTSDLSTARYALATLSERTSKAYFAGGYSTAATTAAERLSFSNDTTAAQGTATLTIARGGVRGLSEGTTKGYWGGGFTGFAIWTAQTDKITFATDSSAVQTSANLSIPRDRYQSMSDGSTKGYLAGGQTGAGISVCDKVTFATDVTNSQTSVAITRQGGTGFADGVSGYALGGIEPAGLSKSGHKFIFATDTVVSLGAGSDLSLARTGLSGFSTVAL
ncbi:MAG: hypothetical protein ACKV0T_27565 [Planctomycetales bacterium]